MSPSLSEFPFQIVPDIPNFRSIGGWPISSPTTAPRYVAPNLIYRGSDPQRITDTGIQQLISLNIKTYFDLRSKQQIDKLGFRDLSEFGIERRWTPVFGEGEYTEEKAGERYRLYASEDVRDITEAFIEILIAGADMFRTVLKHLISTTTSYEDRDHRSPPPALYMHCTTGNNRTGVFVALLLLLLRVPNEYVVYEYTLSEIGLVATRQMNVERLLTKGAFCGLDPSEARRKCERMVGARAESLQALILEVESRWGGAEGYFNDVVGVTEKDIEDLRRVLTVEGESRLRRSLRQDVGTS